MSNKFANPYRPMKTFMAKVRIAHLSTYAGGGAGRAASQLHKGLLGLGYHSMMIISSRHHSEDFVFHVRRSEKFLSRVLFSIRRKWIDSALDRYNSSRPNGSERFSDDRSPFGRALFGQLPACDVLHVHWVSGFLDYRSFFHSVPRDLPIVWTLDDMYHFTGGCHYDAGCGKYVDRCGACPQLGSRNEHDLSRQVWVRKHRAIEKVDQKNCCVVTPSRWLATESKRSSLFGRFPTIVIPHGIDVKVFAPRNRDFCRELLGIPKAAKVILFVAQSLDNKRKGTFFLEKAIGMMPDVGGLFAVTVGKGKAINSSEVPIKNIGTVTDDLLLSIVYSAANVFVIPSLQEGMGLTAMEALACGTPIVGFDTGGIRDMVRPDLTGLLVPVGDVEALRDAVVKLLQDDSKGAEMSANCRRIALEEYSLERQAFTYEKLYLRMLGLEERLW